MSGLAQIRRASAEDVEAVGKLADRVFRPELEPGEGFPVEFPQLFSAENASHLYFIEADGKPVSLVGMMPGEVRLHDCLVSTVSMGSVCTLPEYRGRHYVSQMVAHVIARYQNDFSVLLVSGDRPLYRRAGCVPFGDWLVATLEPPRELPSSTGVTVSFGTAADAEELQTIYIREPVRFRRTPTDMALLLQSLAAPRWRRHMVETLPVVAVARLNGQIVAYLIGARSATVSRQMLAIEWAGARAAIPALADRLRQHFGCEQASFFVSPGDETMKSVLKARSVSWSSEGNVGTLRVLNLARFVEETSPLLWQRAGGPLAIRSEGPEMWTAKEEDGTAHTLSGVSALSTWLFGSGGLGLPFPRVDDLNYI